MSKIKHKLDKCLNCDWSFTNSTKDNFCPNCGQKNSDFAFTLFEVFKTFFGQLATFEFKFWKTFWNLIFKPGFLTNEFKKGKRVKYVSPHRLLFVSSLIFFALLSLNNLNIDNESNSVQEEIMEEDVEINIWNSADQKPYEIALQMLTSKQKYSHQEILDSTKITGKIPILAIKQASKLRENGIENLSKHFFQQLSITILLLIPVFAFLLKIIYVRRKELYVNHLVFATHYQALFYCTFIIAMLLSYFMLDLTGFTLLLNLILLYVSLIKVYKQSYGKTFLKFFILLLSYLFVIVLGMLASLVVSFFLF